MTEKLSYCLLTDVIKNNNTEKSLKVDRSYSDFEWLYN